MRIATWNVQWFDHLIGDDGRPRLDDGPSGRHGISRRRQGAAIGAVLHALDADAVMVIEAPDESRARAGVPALEAFAARFGLRARRAVTGFPSDTRQEITLLHDPAALSARHDPCEDGAPLFDGPHAVELHGVAEAVRWSKPPLEVAVTTPGGAALRLIGVHAKSKTTHGAPLALAGLIAIARSDQRARIILVAWALLFYVVASYQNWHGQSSFGNRFFVSLTALFVPGVAMALSWAGRTRRAMAYALIAALCVWNAGFVFQWGLNIVPNRGPVSFRQVARNQVTVVPSRLASTVVRYFTGRGEFTRDVESGDSAERERYRLIR